MGSGVGSVSSGHELDAEGDARLMGFVRHQVNSFVKWEVVRFFHDNPHATDTADSIAQAVGHESRELARDLQELVASGILYARTVSGMTVYSLMDDDDMRQLLRDFITACGDRGFREAAIQKVIEGLR
jgi:hypothetical protein